MDIKAGLVIVLLTRKIFCVCGYTVVAALHGLSLCSVREGMRSGIERSLNNWYSALRSEDF